LTNLLDGVRIGSQRPRLSQLPAGRHGSAGPDAVELAESCGLLLDDWQRWVLDGMLSEDPRARLCASTSLLVMPRQNGKNAVLEALELYAFYVLGLRRILHTAHLGETSAEHMTRLRELVEANPALERITAFSTANGKERFTRTDTRATIRFVTRSKKTGRGFSPQMIVFDEALHLTDQHLQAIVPAVSAQSMRQDPPIMVYTSSAPLADSVVLNRLRRAAMMGRLPGFYAEWSCEDGVNPEDVNAWYEANPGMGIRISEQFVRDNELAQLSREAFLIERLGVVRGEDVETGVMPLEKWRALVDPHPRPGAGFAGLAIGPGGAWSALGFAGARDGGGLHVQLARHEAGTGWVVEACRRAWEQTGRPVVVDPRSEAGGALAALDEAAVPVQRVSAPELAQACMAFKADVDNLRVWHADQAPLSAAVQHVDVRPAGEGWVFSAKASAIDVTPLLAVVLAGFAARADAAHGGTVHALGDYLDDDDDD